MSDILIKIGSGDHASHGVNMLHICDCVLKDAKDGDEVTFTGKGTFMDHDGMRFLSVHQVDGADVEEMPDNPGDSPQEETQDSQDMMNMDSTDALNNYMKMKGK